MLEYTCVCICLHLCGEYALVWMYNEAVVVAQTGSTLKSTWGRAQPNLNPQTRSILCRNSRLSRWLTRAYLLGSLFKVSFESIGGIFRKFTLACIKTLILSYGQNVHLISLCIGLCMCCREWAAWFSTALCMKVSKAWLVFQIIGSSLLITSLPYENSLLESVSWCREW